MRFSILALGDTSYEFFCQTGKDFDQKLEELGAQRLSPRVDCDLDYDEPVAEWFGQVISALNGAENAQELRMQRFRLLRAQSRWNPNIPEIILSMPKYWRI